MLGQHGQDTERQLRSFKRDVAVFLRQWYLRTSWISEAGPEGSVADTLALSLCPRLLLRWLEAKVREGGVTSSAAVRDEMVRVLTLHPDTDLAAVHDARAYEYP